MYFQVQCFLMHYLRVKVTEKCYFCIFVVISVFRRRVEIIIIVITMSDSPAENGTIRAFKTQSRKKNSAPKVVVSKFQFDLGRVDEEPFRGRTIANCHFISKFLVLLCNWVAVSQNHGNFDHLCHKITQIDS